ncbi:MAG: hypothetical protein Q9202_004737 [Teloschistes flavicans]
MARCLVDLWRLSTCEYAEWDHGLVRETLDVSSIFEQTQKNFSQVKDAAGLDRGGTQDCDFFGIMATKLTSMKVSWDTMSAFTDLATPLPDGLGVMAIPDGLTAEGFEIQFGTNYLGHAILLQLLQPLMLRTARDSSSEKGGNDVRFVAVSSFGHTMAPSQGIEFERLKTPDTGTRWQRYGQSKLADILLAVGMTKRYPEIMSVSVHPGLVSTELGARAARSPMLMISELLRWTPLFKSPEKGAYNVLWAATTAKDHLQGGGYYEPVGKTPGKPRSTSGMTELCRNERLANRLWEWTEKELKELEPL